MNWHDSLTQTFLVRCAGAAASLGYGLLLADVLAPAAMGEFTIAVSVAVISATVAKFGLDAYLLRSAAGHPRQALRITVRCLGVAGLAGVFAWTLCVWAGAVLRPGAGAAFDVLLLGIPFLAMGYVLAGLLKAGDLPAAAIFLETGAWQTVMCACAVLMRIAGSDSTILVAACFAAGAALVFAVFLLVAVRFVFHGGSIKESGPSAVRLREVAPFAGIAIGSVLMRWSDILWIAWWFDAREVAVYMVCTRLAGGIAIVDNAVNAIAAPRFARQHERGQTRALRREFRRACVTSGAFAAFGAAAVAFLGPHALNWLGDPYSGASAILQLAAVAMAIQVSLGPIGHLASMSGRAPDHCKAVVLVLALQQLAFLLFIPGFGVTAALLGFALSRALVYLITLGLMRRRSESIEPAPDRSLRDSFDAPQ